MTVAQLITLKNDILTRWPTPATRPSDLDIAEFYNTPTTAPAVEVWRPVVTIQELNAAIEWPYMITLTQEKQLAFQSMIWANQIDMTDLQVRQGVNAIFAAPMAPGTRNNINGAGCGKRTGTYFETLFVKDTNPVVKVSLFFGELLTPGDVTAALSS